MAAHRFPDFIIAGAPRSATTWLYTLADRHPQIAMAKPVRPEPKFFLVDSLYDRGLEYYASTWFDRLPEGRMLGEKSANYLESRVVAERIHKNLPQVLLIFLLRNPVDRAYSNYLWSQRNGLETETFERALELEEERDRTVSPEWKFTRPHANFSRGLYAEHLIRFFSLFSRKHILVLRMEDVIRYPRELAVRFHTFLSVKPMPELTESLGVINAALPERAPPLAPHLRAALENRYREPNRRLAALLGPEFPIWEAG
jgi:Sulfotransferase domain